MYRRLPESEGNVIGYELHGSLSREEVREVHRQLERAIGDHGSVRLLLDLTDMSLPDPGAIIEDLKLTPEYINSVDRYAVVGSSRWQDVLASATNAMARGEARYFEKEQTATAWAWLRE
jgi:hypothetical protein